jgi:hypothetical protein
VEILMKPENRRWGIAGGRDSALRCPRPRPAAGTNGTKPHDLAKALPRLNGAVTAPRTVPTNFSLLMRTKLAPALLLASLWLAAGCCSVAPKPSPPEPAGAKPHWHSIVVVPGTNAPVVHTYNKFNPIWWVGNASEPHAPAWYRPNGAFRDICWWLRNPFNNFSAYVIGVADKETVRYGVYPAVNGNPHGGWNFAVTRRCIVYLPFVDYKRGRFEFYFGWRKAGNFGIKLNFRQSIRLPPDPAVGATTRRQRFFIWDQPIDF